jgi:hypothetical protein
MNLRPTLLVCAAVILVVVAVLFIWLPPPFNGNELVLGLDIVVLIAGVLGVIVVPLVMMRSGWAVLVSAIAIPVFLFSVSRAAVYIPYGWAWLHCLRQPVMVTRFAAANTYALPGDLSYGPNAFAEYVCTQQDAEAAGYRRTPLR